MTWKKKGKIFDTEQYGFYYAKSPQAIVFENFIRVYFSTCERDGEKLISQVAYVDYENDFSNIINVSNHYVISRGNLGCYDEHGIFPFSPIRIEGKIYAYLGGWTRRISVSADSSIGLAISDDGGETFNRVGEGPVLTASLFEPNLINDGFVKVIDGIFHMWYIYGVRWLSDAEMDGEPERVYKIAHATSYDGIEWVKEGRAIIPDALDANECQALPTVIKYQGKYHMYFCFRHARDFRKNKEKSYRIGYAFSDDLTTWKRDDANVGIQISMGNEWDSNMMCYPNVFECNGKIYMLYNGNEFGKYGFGLAELEENFDRKRL